MIMQRHLLSFSGEASAVVVGVTTGDTGVPSMMGRLNSPVANSSDGRSFWGGVETQPPGKARDDTVDSRRLRDDSGDNWSFTSRDSTAGACLSMMSVNKLKVYSDKEAYFD